MTVPSEHEKALMHAQMRAITVTKGKPYTDLPAQSTLAAIVKHGGLYTLLDADLMTGRMAAFAADPSARSAQNKKTALCLPTPDVVQKLRSTVASFFYKLVDGKGYTVHSELIAYISEPGTDNGVTYDVGVDPSPDIPAAFTFVGQFIDHDLTFNGMNLTVDQHGVVADNASPLIDLDHVYGPRSMAGEFPEIFEQDGRFKLVEKPIPNSTRKYYDVPRHPDPTNPNLQAAYIFDPRNDENQMILQVHILIERLHNKILADPQFKSELAKLKNPNTSQIVDCVRREVVLIWQSFILNDYMAKILQKTVRTFVLDEIKKKDYGKLKHKPLRDLVTGKNIVRMPHEFAIGFRFGHSQLRPAYKVSEEYPPVLLFKDARHNDKVEIDGFTVNGLDDLRGGRDLAPEHAIDWKIFYPEKPTPETMSLRIDGKVTARVFNLPESAIPDDIKYIGNLPHRNLLRGSQIGVVSGEELAKFYGIPALTAKQVLGKDYRNASRELFELDPDPKGEGAFRFKTPLWYYILKEAEVEEKGARLGNLGSHLVGEVLAGACYYGDDFRYDDGWKPRVNIKPSSSSNAITLRDIINYIQG